MGWQTQNFLVELRTPALQDRLLRLAALRSDDVVVDLGAGHGELTDLLRRHCRRVIAVEDDPRLARILRHRFAEEPKVLVREQDLFQMRLPREPYKVVANIPFDATARLVSRLTSARHAPTEAHLVMQREAAERIVGVPRQTLFGLVRQPWFEPRIVHRFRRTDFAPRPRVDIVLLRLRKRGPPLVSDHLRAFFIQFVTYSFVCCRRTVACTLDELIGHGRTRRLARSVGNLDVPPSCVPPHAWIAVFEAIAADDEVRWRVRGVLARRPRRLP